VAKTIRDVAAHAGLSVMTVSRALNSEPNVSAEARERVRKAVAELGYRRNAFARGLPGSRSFLICLLVPEVIPGYIAELQLGAVERCRSAGYHLVARSYHTQEHRYADVVRDAMATLRPDGFIVTPPLSDDPDVLDALDASKIPYVRFSPGVDAHRGASISIDEAEAARQMTRVLIEAGHRRIGFIKALPTHRAASLRYDGYRRALEEAGLPLEADLVRQGDLEFPGGVACGLSLLEQTDRPSVIFACNDDMAMGVIAAANRLGLRVPDAVSVVGFDDSELARLSWPQLTTVRQPVRKMAAAAAALLIEQASSGQARAEHLHADFEIVRRGSLAS